MASRRLSQNLEKLLNPEEKGSDEGGIWNVNKKAFEGTKDTKNNSDIKEKHYEIKKLFGVDWSQVQWSEMKKPLYSGLAAWLVLFNIPDAIPVELEGQAKY